MSSSATVGISNRTQLRGVSYKFCESHTNYGGVQKQKHVADILRDVYGATRCVAVRFANEENLCSTGLLLSCQLHAVPGTRDSLIIVTFAFVAFRLTLPLTFLATYVAWHSQAVSHSFLIAETRTESEDNPRGICDGCNGAGEGFPLGTYVLPCISSSEYVTRLSSSTVLEDITIGTF